MIRTDIYVVTMISSERATVCIPSRLNIAFTERASPIAYSVYLEHN